MTKHTGTTPKHTGTTPKSGPNLGPKQPIFRLAITRFSKCQEEYSIEDVDRLAFLRIMTSSRSLGCYRSKTWRITSRIGACQACLHLMCRFTDVCACEIRRREVNEACRCTRPDGIALSKVSTSDDACDDPFLVSAKSVTVVSTIVRVHVYELCLTQSLGL